MDTSMNFVERDKFLHLFRRHMNLFDCFTNIYLFGSVAAGVKNPNDIDILLIYSEYSENIPGAVNIIRSTFETLSKLSVDLTVLSAEEERGAMFLKRLDSKYIKLK